jgi:hypothetical protein
MIRFAARGALIGVAVCVLLIAVWKASAAARLWTISGAVERIAPALWPASFGLMAIHPDSTTTDIVVVYAILILLNAVFYAAVGVVVGVFIRFSGRRRI